MTSVMLRICAMAATLINGLPGAYGEEPKNMTPPVAKKIPQELEKHGDVRVDDYYWLRERDNPEVIAYLEAENEYTAKVMAHTESFQEALFEEIK